MSLSRPTTSAKSWLICSCKFSSNVQKLYHRQHLLSTYIFEGSLILNLYIRICRSLIIGLCKLSGWRQPCKWCGLTSGETGVLPICREIRTVYPSTTQAIAGQRVDGGRGGIRTHGTREGSPDFESGAFNHSATLPSPNQAAIMRDFSTAASPFATVVGELSFFWLRKRYFAAN